MKVSIIGAGNVGGTLAQRIAESGLCDVVLLDIAEGIPQGKALDLADGRAVTGHSQDIVGTQDYKAIADSAVVVVTAGLPRQPGMTREDLLKKNAVTIRKVVGNIVEHSPQAILLMVTNPLDILTYVAFKESGFDPHRVIGMGGVLDACRFANLVAEELHVSAASIQAMVIGAHGQTMIPLVRYCSVAGIPIAELLPEKKIKEVIGKTVQRGAQIVSLLGKGSAYYAPSAAAFSMVRAIIKDEKKVLPASVFCDGEYGLQDVCIGVPVRLGKRGIEEIVQLKLTDKEQQQLGDSAEAIKKAVTGLFPR